MSGYSKEDIIRMVREEDIEFIRLQFTDIFGQLKDVAITASQIEKAVNGRILFRRFFHSRGLSGLTSPTKYLYPDLKTLP